MRVLLLTDEYPPHTTGGIGTYTANAAAALHDAGHEVHVLWVSWRPATEAADSIEHGVHVHRRQVLPGARLARGRVAGRIALAVSHGVWARRLGPFDVIEAPEWQAQGLAFVLGRPNRLVVTLHTPDAVVARFAGDPRAGRHLSDRLEALVVRRAAAVSAVSQLLVDDLRSSGWLGDRQVSIVPPPLRSIDAPSSSDAARADDQPHDEPADDEANDELVVLGVGRIEPRKGFDVLLEAVARLTSDHAPEAAGRTPPMRLVLVGADTIDGHGASEAGRLRAEARRRGVTLELVGAVSHAEVTAWLDRAIVVAAPSRFDNLAQAGIEALAAGRPLVTTDRTGLAEHDDGTDAITVVPVDDPDALAAALRPLLADAARARRAGTAARGLAERTFHPRAFAAARTLDLERVATGRTGTNEG